MSGRVTSYIMRFGMETFYTGKYISARIPYSLSGKVLLLNPLHSTVLNLSTWRLTENMFHTIHILPETLSVT